MDRNVLTATILIALIMIVWLTWLAPEPSPVDQQTVDTLATRPDLPQEIGPGEPPIGERPEMHEGDSTFVAGPSEAARLITIENDLYTAVFSTNGATLVSMQLKEYETAVEHEPVQIVDTTKTGALSLVFTAPNSRIYDTRNFSFSTDFPSDRIDVGDGERDLTFRTAVGDGSIEMRYTFVPESYEIRLDIDMRGAESFMTGEGYQVTWNGGLPFTEEDIEQSVARTGAFARSGGEVESVTLVGDPEGLLTLNGQVDWVAVKNKYFTAVILPSGETRGAELLGTETGSVSASYLKHEYVAGLMMAPPAGVDEFRLYLGPMEYGRIGDYDVDLYDMVDYGWDFFEIVTRPLARFVFIPVFNFLGRWIHNYGIVIIIFSVLIKLLLYPLTKKSFTSMAKMRELGPRMEAIKEKYGDNPQKQQEAMMKMYKETGVNPLGGCMPMLLQYPIIIALWQFLPQAIEIRQQGFLWAEDLSAPDVILSLPFTIPFYGDFVAGFTVLMGISMIIQMRLQGTASTNPQAKIFMYLFPVMIFFIFNRLAAGLNLYYLCYNVLTAAQQKYINKHLKEHPEEMAPVKTAKKGASRKGTGASKRGLSSSTSKRSSSSRRKK